MSYELSVTLPRKQATSNIKWPLRSKIYFPRITSEKWWVPGKSFSGNKIENVVKYRKRENEK